MPIRDDQLERSIQAAAPHVSTVGVFDRVAYKRARRRTVRRVEFGALALALVAVLSTVVLLARDDGQVTRVAAPGGATGVRVVPGGASLTQGAGSARAPVPIALDPDQGYIRGPLVVSGSTLSLAAYDHDGSSFTYPPSRIVRVDTGTFREEGRTDLKAEILSIADGEGARWVVTRNPAPANGLPDAFLKRIGADGAVVSKLLPPGSDPVGNVAVGAGSVWIPVRDGVLRYDATTGQFASKTDLAATDTRAVAVANGTVLVTDGEQLRTLAGANFAAAGNRDFVGLVGTVDGFWDLTGAPPGSRAAVTHIGSEPILLPVDFAPVSVTALDGRVWVEGTVNGSPAVALVDGTAIRSTVVLDGGRDASFAWVRDDTVLAVSGGTLLRIDLTK